MVKTTAERRDSLLRSISQHDNGHCTTAAVSRIAKGLNGRTIDCTIDKYCQTYVFEFPKTVLKNCEHQDPVYIYEDDEFRTVIVMDVKSYFERFTKSPHYSICYSLRYAVDNLQRNAKHSSGSTNLDMFFIIEEFRSIKTAHLNNGECFIYDEIIEGEEMIKGGREGERRISAVQTSDGTWPAENIDVNRINMILAAIKAEQEIDYNISELINYFCYINTENKPVYPMYPRLEIGHGGLRVVSPVDFDELEAKTSRIQMIIKGLHSDRDKPEVAELIDALRLEKSNDDNYFRLWYLRLWEAAHEAGKSFGIKQFENSSASSGGKEIRDGQREHRNAIAHWRTGKIDFSVFGSFQRDVLKMIHRKYIGK